MGIPPLCYALSLYTGLFHSQRLSSFITDNDFFDYPFPSFPHQAGSSLGAGKISLFRLHLQPPSTLQAPSRWFVYICSLNSRHLIRALKAPVKFPLLWSLSVPTALTATANACPQNRFLLSLHLPQAFYSQGTYQPSGCRVHHVTEVKEVTDN